jgi:predicted phosphodiesterase
MVRAQVISDLHTCFYHGQSLDMLKRLNIESDLDFLLIPGDVVVPARQKPKECKEVFEYLSTKAKHCVYVVGNHEFYHSNRETTEEAIRGMLPKNFEWLNNTDVTLEGVHFYGGTLWFKDDPFNQIYEHQLNDFNLIKGIHGWVYESNKGFRENGNNLIRPETVVITHHMPSPLGTPKAFEGSELNRFFVSDETQLITDKQPKVWVFGHTHTDVDVMVGATRLLAHPYGYPSERRGKEYPPVVIEL